MLPLKETIGSKLARDIMKIGLAHARREIPVFYIILAMGIFIKENLRSLLNHKKTELIIPLFKFHFWALNIMLEAYNKAQLLSLEKATKISESLYKRLISLKAEEVYNKLSKYISID